MRFVKRSGVMIGISKNYLKGVRIFVAAIVVLLFSVYQFDVIGSFQIGKESINLAGADHVEAKNDRNNTVIEVQPKEFGDRIEDNVSSKQSLELHVVTGRQASEKQKNVGRVDRRKIAIPLPKLRPDNLRVVNNRFVEIPIPRLKPEDIQNIADSWMLSPDATPTPATSEPILQ